MYSYANIAGKVVINKFYFIINIALHNLTIKIKKKILFIPKFYNMLLLIYLNVI